MSTGDQAFANSRALVWAGAAVLCGCALLMVMGAPVRMPLMNAAAFLIGLALLGIVHGARRLGASALHADWVLICLALVLPVTAWAGAEMDGVSRWLVVAGITIQPSLVVAPLLAIAFAAGQSRMRLLAIALASAGLAMQPDPGGAAMLFLGLSAPLLIPANRRAFGMIAAGLSGATLALSVAKSVGLPPAPFVEEVIGQAALHGPLPALLAALAIGLLFMPVRTATRSLAFAFAATWAAGLGASLAGPYPTPVLGFGGSAVLGYVLGVGLLIATAANKPVAIERRKARDVDDDNTSLRFV